MKFNSVVFATLFKVLQRDGLLIFLKKSLHYLFDFRAYLWLIRGGRHQNELNSSVITTPIIDDSESSRVRSRRIFCNYNPKISVVVTSYNYAHLIRETLDSLVAQTYKNFEVLVVDNGSEDNSVDIIKEYVKKYSNFSLLQHEGCVNKGLPASVKLGTERATGEFVAFCEADDIWMPEHLQKKVDLLREYLGKPNIIINDIELFGDPERCKEVSGWLVNKAPVLANVRNVISPTTFHDDNWICTFSICMVRRSVLLSCDMLSVPYPSHLDWWLWRQICFNNEVWCVHEKLTKWRLHKDSYLMRDTTKIRLLNRIDMIAKMDHFLVEKYPIQARELERFLRPEDLFSCFNGQLYVGEVKVRQPLFSIILSLDERDELIHKTLLSIISQTYNNWEIVPYSIKGVIPQKIEDLFLQLNITNRIRTSKNKLSTFQDAAINTANGEWVIGILPGDQFRPTALQVFAARITVSEDMTAILGKAQCVFSDKVFWNTNGVGSANFACPGSFAIRRDGGCFGAAYLPRYFVNSWLSLVDRLFKSSSIDYCDQILLLHDDSEEGPDPNCRYINAAIDEFAKSSISTSSKDTLFDTDKISLKNSQIFDKEWYLKENHDIIHNNIDPIEHYVRHGALTCDKNPSPDFINEEYLALNPDVRFAMMNPAGHYERHGKAEKRQVSFLQLPPNTSFPSKAIETEIDFGTNSSNKQKRLALFAAFSASGRISETTLHYLKGLKEVCDNIVFVMNAPILHDEVEKLRGIVRYAIFRHHGGYDFNSWKIGYELSKKIGLLKAGVTSELILSNDSCYGPVFPFSEAFETMKSRECDFWGLTSYCCEFVNVEHIQSYFVVLREKILKGPAFEKFLNSSPGSSNRWLTIIRCEAGLTNALSSAGYKWDTLCPKDFYLKYNSVPFTRPLMMMENYKIPLVKVKALAGEMMDSRDDVVNYIKRYNPKLASLLPEATPQSNCDFVDILKSKREKLHQSYHEVIRRISNKVALGEKIKVLFFVSSPSMFPARPLLDLMLEDELFEPKIFVIPDMREFKSNPNPARENCRNELGTAYPDSIFLEGDADALGLWPDIIESFGADIVCYPSPYDLSSFRYNPHYAVGRSFLPIHVNYGFYNSCYDRSLMGRQNYAYFWKAFFECDATAAEYKKYSILKGANADVVGYIKMDALATAKPLPRKANRKRVLIAPHHSVEGGANDTLALSNFQRYADYFLKLPEKFPNVDFVFRPHPSLFTILSAASKWGQAKVDTWIETMKSYPNVIWSDDGDYFPVFASCDGAIQDCGSYLVEWFYTGKPCCYMLKSPSDIESKFAPLGKECLSHCYIAYDELAIEAFLNEVIVNECDSKAVSRSEFSKTIMLNYPNAAKAALDSIRKSLGVNNKL